MTTYGINEHNDVVHKRGTYIPSGDREATDLELAQRDEIKKLEEQVRDLESQIEGMFEDNAGIDI